MRLHRSMFNLRLSIAYALYAFGCGAMWAQGQPPSAEMSLTRLQLARVRHHNPADASVPGSSQVRLPDSVGPEDALRISYGTEVSFAVPAGSQSFSAVVGHEANTIGMEQGDKAPNLALVEVRLDDKLALTVSLEGSTPPQAISVPLLGTHALTFRSYSQFNGGNFYLARANFSNSPISESRIPVLKAGDAYLELGGEARQSLFHAFHPGESVSLTVFFAGDAPATDVSIVLRPENSSQPHSVSISVPLAPRSNGIRSGQVSWKVPLHNGPARLEISATLQGRTIWQENRRIGVAARPDLAAISDSTFGVHLSTTGFPLLGDLFADLWGAKWGRIYLRWSIIEPQEGRYDFSRADELVDLYRAQNIRVLGVLGEDFPAWVGAAGPSMYAAWSRFVTETAKHFNTRIDHWDLFNEIDVKYYARLASSDLDSDITILRDGLDALHASSPQSLVICCSTGTSAWLTYDKRLLDRGVLEKANIASVHPYETVPPEVRQGMFDYEETLQALRKLDGANGGPKTIWATEANWIIGPPATLNVNAYRLNEHQQAQNVVRVNLLSFAQGVPFFLHSGFNHWSRPQIHLDTLTAYAAMSSFFSGAASPRWLSKDPNAMCLVAGRGGELVGAIWNVGAATRVRMEGISQARFFDLYGNPLVVKPEDFALSPDPIYFRIALPSSPALSILSNSRRPEWQNLPPLSAWATTKDSTYTLRGATLRVSSAASKYAYQLRSPVINTQPDACYVAEFRLRLLAGVLSIMSVDADTGKKIGSPEFINYPPASEFVDVTLPFQPDGQNPVKLIIANGNLTETSSSFEIQDPVRLRTCYF